MSPSLLLSLALAQAPIDEGIPAAVAVAAFALLLESRQGSERVLCLVVEGGDPPHGLDALAAATLARVVPGSECHYAPRADRREAALTRNGEPAEFISLSSFEHRSPHEVAVSYEYRAGSWTGTGSVLLVSLENGTWKARWQSPYHWVE